jgi:AhpD family alkylhydroperoxidase
MTARTTTTISPVVITAVRHLYKAMNASGDAASTLELVHLRASHINRCSASLDAGVETAQKAGVSVEKLLATSGWTESPLFTDAEKAALALTEAATRLADNPGAVTDEIWAQAAQHVDDNQLNGIVLMLATTNFFNRINTTLRVPAGTRWG